jgi:integrase
MAHEAKNSQKKQSHRNRFNYAHAKSMTVGDLFELWWERVTTVGQTKRGPLSEGTASRRRSLWDARVKPQWEHVRLDMVSHDKAARWLEREAKKPRTSDHTLYSAGNMLLQILNEGVRLGILAENPAKDRLGNALYVPANRVEKSHIYLTPQQLFTLVEHMRSPRDKAMVLVAGLSGLRFGELTALQWSDIDFTRREIGVTKAWSKGKLKLPKTDQTRTTPLHKPTSAALQQLTQGDPCDYIFQSRFGNPLTMGSWRDRFAPIVKELNKQGKLPAMTFHDLRHTAVSIGISANLNIKVIQNIAGHESAYTTLNVYAGLFNKDLSDATDKVDSLLSGHFLDTRQNLDTHTSLQ